MGEVMNADKKWEQATIIIAILVIILTPIFVYTETKRRGYFAVGGEWFLPFLPLAVQGLKFICRDIKNLFNF